MKKFISLVLTLVMVMGLTTVAWGAATEVGTYADFKTAVQAGGEVKLTANIEGDGIVIDNSVTIDLNGFSYTINGKTVGSNHTETLGMQINESAGTVVIKNGSIIGSDAATKPASTCGVTGCTAAGHTDVDIPNNGVKMVIQNYADLTLSGVTVTGTAAAKYVVSNNCGDVVLENTTINATGTNVAFDTCKYASYAAPTVTVKGTSVINGKVEIAGGDLEVEGGTVNGEIAVVTGGAAADVTISGGTFASALPTGVTMASGTELISDGAGGYIAAAAAPGNTAATKFYVSDASATGGWKLLNSFSATKPTDLFVEADYDEYVPEGNLDHYDIDGAYYAVAAMNVAEYKLVYGNKVIYLNPVDADEIFYEAQAKVFTGVTADKDACGKVLVSKADLKKTYYVVTLEDTDGNEQKYYLVKVNAGGQTTLLVDGKIVEADFVNTFIEHNWVGNDVDKNGNYVSVACSRCGKIATLYANKTAAGKDAEFITGFGWITASAASYISAGAIDTTVESAETFDAGIAMYVGMSVMAAAGSAVVLKKKD